MLVLYVDDLLVAARHMSDLSKFWSKLEKRFKIRTMGEPKFLLGMEVCYLRAWIDLAISMLLYLGYVKKISLTRAGETNYSDKDRLLFATSKFN